MNIFKAMAATVIIKKKTHDGKKSLIFSSQMAFYIGVHFIPNWSGENKNNSFIRWFSKRVNENETFCTLQMHDQVI